MIMHLITIYRNFLRQLMRHQLSLVLIPITVLLLIGTLVVLAIWRNGDYLYSPSPDIQLQADDELIVFAPSQQRDIFGQATQ